MSTGSTATRASSSDVTFPGGFVWGAATAAYQIEGAASEGGRTPSIWDTFSHTPGAVAGADNGDVACDHYHRFRDDVALMSRLHLGAYRFSTAWPRICPRPGAVNAAGLDFYSRLVDSLLEAGITPWLTLYHWDLPQVLEDRGGWTDRDVAERFTEYALATHAALGDRVRHWITLNEPWCSAFLGYVGGEHAPGRQDPQAGAAAVHHLLLAHGTAVRALRDADASALLGITVNTTVADPAVAASAADQAAARRMDALFNRVFLDPLMLGSYPQEAVEGFGRLGARFPVREGDLDVISTPIDFLGVNYYHGHAVSAEGPEPAAALPEGAPVRRTTVDPFATVAQAHAVSRGLPRTGMGWEIQPDGIRRLLERLQREYTGPAGIPLYVTENGAAFDDEVRPDGSVDDEARARFIEDHLREVHAALNAGVDVRGYFAWSLLDNFEWAHGYAQRFGIVRVDFDSQQRTPKASAGRYAEIARTGRVPAASGSLP
jgi:beta-glucosidase